MLMSSPLYSIAVVAKPSDRVMGSDCGENLGDGNFEGFQQASFGSA